MFMDFLSSFFLFKQVMFLNQILLEMAEYQVSWWPVDGARTPLTEELP